MSVTTKTTLDIVDQLGMIEDQIEALKVEAESLKDQIKLLGKGTYAGSLYITTIKYTAEKKSTSWASVAKELNAPDELVAKHTKVTRDILSAETKQLSN